MKNEFVHQIVDANYNLDIFEMVTRTNEPIKDIVKKMFLIFRYYQITNI
jgi:hypothetical protein